MLFLAFIARSCRVTEENLLFETVQSGPSSSLHIFTAGLKGSHFCIFICNVSFGHLRSALLLEVLRRIYSLLTRHFCNMASPSKQSKPQKSINALHPYLLQNFGIWILVSPSDFSNFSGNLKGNG